MNALMNPAEIAAATALRSGTEFRAERRTEKVSKRAIGHPHPDHVAPLADSPIQQSEGRSAAATQKAIAPSAGHHSADVEPRVELAPYAATDEVREAVEEIINLHRLRQRMIRAQTGLKLQGMGAIRFATALDDDFATDEAKARARKRNEDMYRQIVSDPSHELHQVIAPYLVAMEPLDSQRLFYERSLVKAAKRLPVYPWVKSVKGFGDISFATIVGECGDIGSYRSVSAVWKRLGLAVIDGKRQGAPGEGAAKEMWIEHGYNAKRRSVSWNARGQVIGGMGKWRPEFGEDVEANPDLTYYQRLYATRARYECDKLDLPLERSAKGKESYKGHVCNRAHRYVEKRLIKHLYLEWRRAGREAA